MPGLSVKARPLIKRDQPYPGDVSTAGLNELRSKGLSSVAAAIESFRTQLLQVHRTLREATPEIHDFKVVDNTGRVIGAIGPLVVDGIQTSGGFFAELYAGDPYGNSDPSQAILSVKPDGSVTIGENGFIDVLDPFGGDAAWIGCQFDTLPVTGAANNGSGLIRLTVVGHTLLTGDNAQVRAVGGVPNANGGIENGQQIWTVTKIDADHVDLQNSVFDGTYTSGGTIDRLLHISGAANNGSGLIRLTTSVAHTYETGDTVNVQVVGGVPNANGNWIITVIDSTHFDLQGSMFAGAYTSGGTCLRYFAGMLAQTFAIGESFANYNLRGFADGSLKIRNATISLTNGTNSIVLDPSVPKIVVSSTSGTLTIDASVPELKLDAAGVTSKISNQTRTVAGVDYITGLEMDVSNGDYFSYTQAGIVGFNNSVSAQDIILLRDGSGIPYLLLNGPNDRSIYLNIVNGVMTVEDSSLSKSFGYGYDGIQIDGAPCVTASQTIVTAGSATQIFYKDWAGINQSIFVLTGLSSTVRQIEGGVVKS